MKKTLAAMIRNSRMYYSDETGCVGPTLLAQAIAIVAVLIAIVSWWLFEQIGIAGIVAMIGLGAAGIAGAARLAKQRRSDGIAGSPVRATGTDALAEIIKQSVSPGLLAFNPPSDVRQGRKERVEVSIARSAELREAIMAGLHGRGEVQIRELPTSTYMTVDLKGDAFSVVTFSPAEQIVAPTARWEFDVVALKSGTQPLTLCVNLRILGSRTAASGRMSIPVIEQQIRVHTSIGYSTRVFVGGNWQWLIGTGVAFGGGAAALIAALH